MQSSDSPAADACIIEGESGRLAVAMTECSPSNRGSVLTGPQGLSAGLDKLAARLGPYEWPVCRQLSPVAWP